jgi:hypothetical protein
MKFRLRAAFCLLAGATLVAGAAQAQFGGLGELAKKVVPSRLSTITSGPQPISTSILDAIYGDPTKDGFTPSGKARPLMSLPRTATGGFVLQIGYFEMSAQSYCLHAGTHGPGGGDGYLYAPVKGSARDAVISILQNSVAHPEIDQHDIQALLWAIVARAKFEDLNSSYKLTASKLLTPKQLASLNRNALSVLTSPQLAQLTGGAPPLLRQVMAAESRMRGLLSVPGTAYADLERAAVLSGAAPRGEGSIDTPATRWSAHPDGYFIRFLPRGYRQTIVQIWVPTKSIAIGKPFDPATHIAVPGNTSRQRLAQSGRLYQ